MTNFNLSTVKGQCSSFWLEVINQKGLVKNQDGTLSVYLKNSNNIVTPYDITKTCCDVLNDITKEGYFYDLNVQKCRWSVQSALDCGFDKPFKIVLNPVGNDGAIFSVSDGDTSSLVVDFDYLFKFDCESLSSKLSPVKPLNPDLTQQIKDIENQIIIQTSKCEEISSRLAYAQAQFDNTRYSVSCDLFSSSNNTVSNQPILVSGVTTPIKTTLTGITISPVPTYDFLNNLPSFITPNTSSIRTPISDLFVPQITPNLLNQLVFTSITTATTATTPVFPKVPIFKLPTPPVTTIPVKPILINPLVNGAQIIPFTRTGFGLSNNFGGISPFSFPNTIVNSNTNNNFCIIEPLGLIEWESILGAVRFANFIDGDENSYTCRDVYQLYYSPNAVSLIYSCTTPFGTKTTLQKNIGSIVQEQNECESALIDLGIRLDTLKAINTTDTDTCGTPISVLENLSVSVTIEASGSDGILATVYEYQLFDKIGSGNLYNYLVSTKDDSGLFICGEPTNTETWATGCTSLIYPEFSGVVIPETNKGNTNVTACSKIKEYLSNTLFNESGLSGQTNGVTVFKDSLTSNIFSSNWLHSTQIINDPDIIKLITNKKIKVSLKVNSSCGDLCLLIDNISLEKNETKVTGNNIILTQSPSFKLTRTIDNKKSWLNNNSFINREFSISKVSGGEIRQTDYNSNDERLIINTKEIDLDFNLSRGVENDVWNFLTNNINILTGDSVCVNCFASDPKTFEDDECFSFQDNFFYEFQDAPSASTTICCGDNGVDFSKLLTTDISTIKTINNFENVLISELIDGKNRQTLSAYPTLRAVYDRYLLANSNKFDYYSMEQFSNLIGNYWVDIIEQVVPATSIWGSTKIYRNTIFDSQKYKYKGYTLQLCTNIFEGIKVLSPVNVIKCNSVEVHSSIISGNVNKSINIISRCDYVATAQFNTSSEFIGTVKVIQN